MLRDIDAGPCRVLPVVRRSMHAFHGLRFVCGSGAVVVRRQMARVCSYCSLLYRTLVLLGRHRIAQVEDRRAQTLRRRAAGSGGRDYLFSGHRYGLELRPLLIVYVF